VPSRRLRPSIAGVGPIGVMRRRSGGRNRARDRAAAGTRGRCRRQRRTASSFQDDANLSSRCRDGDVAMAMSPMLRWALARVPLSVRKPRACARRVRGAGVRLQHRRLLVAVDPSPAASLFHGRSGFLPAPGECQQGSSTSTTAPMGHLPKARSRPNTQGPSSLEARKPPTVPISMARAMPSKPSIVLRSRSC
jgi:hypothetical protein